MRICACGLSVTREWNGVRNCVLFSELDMLKLGTSCVVCNRNHTLGRMWTQNFSGKSEFRLLVQNT